MKFAIQFYNRNDEWEDLGDNYCFDTFEDAEAVVKWRVVTKVFAYRIVEIRAIYNEERLRE